jgi:hypothetical protein
MHLGQNTSRSRYVIRDNLEGGRQVRFRSAVFLGILLVVGPAGSLAQVRVDVDPAGAGLPLFRPENAVAVMVRATDTWLAVPTDPHDMLGDYRFLPHYATDETAGQVFMLLETEAGPPVADPSGRLVAVPWTLGCGCAEEGWEGTEWVPPGDTVVFLLSRTREKVPWEGPPVFDVLGWHQPYPIGEFIPYWRHTRAEPPEWLTPREFLHLLGALPTESAFQLDPLSSSRAVRDWLEENPGRDRAFPMPTVLWELKRLTGIDVLSPTRR